MTPTTLAWYLGEMIEDCYIRGLDGADAGAFALGELLALPPDRRAALAAELLDVETLAGAIHSTPDALTGPGEGDPCLACSDQAEAILAALRSPK